MAEDKSSKVTNCCTNGTVTNGTVTNGTAANGSSTNDTNTSCGSFSPSKLIQKKRDGDGMTKEEMQWFIKEVSKNDGGCITDSQIGAWLMASYLKDFTPDETAWMTEAMLYSGDTMEWPKEFKGYLVDKHSTGGVGDKVSLPLAPALAACSLKVPMISGRGLGHTGGTLDKLESVPNYQVSGFNQEKLNQFLRDVGCFIIGQSCTLVPADKKLYAVRDVTATVSSLALIVSSIMSKKAAEMVDALVLDVKCGKGAFMTNVESSRQLAKRMVATGSSLGIKMVSVITEMDCPIGQAIGNSIEVAESLQCLQGKSDPDLLELVCALGGNLLVVSGHAKSLQEGSERIQSVLEDGSALEKFKQMIINQGVEATFAEKLVNLDLTDLDSIWSLLQKSAHVTDLQATNDGYVDEIDSVALAVVAKELGAGREEEGAPVDHSVGLQLFTSRGSQLKEGEKWIRVYHQSELSNDHRIRIQGALSLTKDKVEKRSRVIEVIKG